MLSGDFCQLPPVPDQLGGSMLPIKFAFEAASWSKCVASPVVLQKVFRQEDRGMYTLTDDAIVYLNWFHQILSIC